MEPPARSKGFGAISNQSLADQARDLIREAIFNGKIKPEERLTIERIAAEFGISRTPVREALKALETDGIVRIEPHRGAVVQRFDEDELYDRYSIRALLEGYAGELACQRDALAVARDLERNCAELKKAMGSARSDNLDTIQVLVQLNLQFHERILEASGSATLRRLLETLRMPFAYRLYNWRVPQRQNISLDFHRKIAKAFRARQPDQVRRLMEAHVLEARDFLTAAGKRNASKGEAA
jgi:GntR family transcriptional regulator, vanillate catabolism transcriptional regulator